MVLGLLPSVRGGLGELAKTGQHSRLVEGYFRPYARAFDGVRYFSYLPESLRDYVDDREILAKVQLFPGVSWHPWIYGFVMPFRYWRQFRGCAVIRVFQLTGVLPALIARRLLGIPFVVTYGFWYSNLARTLASRWLRRWLEAISLPVADAVIVTTPELAAYVAERLGSSAKIHLIPNGVDTTRFRPAPPGPRPVKRAVYVGRLSKEKNLDTLIDAAGKLVGRIGIEVTFIGDGPLRAQLEGKARRLGVSADFLPFVDHRELPRVLATADVFVLPSFTEGHPKVLLEAMSCGLPCVASDVGGNQAILVNGHTGLLFDPTDAAQLADRIERVLTQEDLARSLGERARAQIIASYDLGVLVEREIELLRRVGGAG